MADPCAFYRDTRIPYCSALKTLACKHGGRCSFRKTLQEYQAQNRACLLRLHKLRRQDLIHKYSSDKMPLAPEDAA